MIKQQFNALLVKEMDRKEFLKYSGGVLLAAVGVTGVAKAMLSQGGIVLPSQDKKDASSLGYGGSAYGR